jgi:hypothetical protein
MVYERERARNSFIAHGHSSLTSTTLFLSLASPSSFLPGAPLPCSGVCRSRSSAHSPWPQVCASCSPHHFVLLVPLPLPARNQAGELDRKWAHADFGRSPHFRDFLLFPPSTVPRFAPSIQLREASSTGHTSLRPKSGRSRSRTGVVSAVSPVPARRQLRTHAGWTPLLAIHPSHHTFLFFFFFPFPPLSLPSISLLHIS